MSSRTPCWSHQPRTNHDSWGAEAFTVAMPYEIPKRDVLTTYCAQSTFMGCHSQVRMHTREITIRKSHPLEGSCQEAIRPLYTTFDIFSRCVPIGTLHPPMCDLRRIRVFIIVASAPLRRTSHPSGSRRIDVSRSRQASAPGTIRAPENPRFPAVSNRIHLTDVMAPSRVQLFKSSRQRRRKTSPVGGRPSVTG